MTKKEKGGIGIQVGTTPESMDAVANCILDILSSGQDQSTMVVALETLRYSSTVSGVTVSECNIHFDSND